jgi:hypothetical protein
MPAPEPLTGIDMLIDHYLPRFDVTAFEHTVADADVATTWSALQRLDLMRVHTPLMNAAMSFVGCRPERARDSAIGPHRHRRRPGCCSPTPVARSRAGCRWANAPKVRSRWAPSADSGSPTSSGTTSRK